MTPEERKKDIKKIIKRSKELYKDKIFNAPEEKRKKRQAFYERNRKALNPYQHFVAREKMK
jgi:hypothetical protein